VSGLEHQLTKKRHEQASSDERRAVTGLLVGPPYYSPPFGRNPFFGSHDASTKPMQSQADGEKEVGG